MKKARFNLVMIAIIVCYVAILLVGNVFRVSVPVATVPGSYAEQYANQHHIEKVSLADSNKEYFDERYETFDYNTDANGVTIEGYSGQSETLVIPSKIGGKPVAAIGADFFKSLTTVKTVYIPGSVKDIATDGAEKLALYCDPNSAANQILSDAGCKPEPILDSDFIDFSLGDNPFEFNVGEGSVQVTGYTGKDAIVVVPSHINGIPVTAVSFDMVGNYKGVVFPDTVNEITGKTSKLIYTEIFAIEFLFTLLAFAIAILAVNIILPRYRRADEFFLSAPQMVVTFLYVLLQTAFGVLAIFKMISVQNYIALIVSAVMLVLYVVCVFLLQGNKEHAVAIEAKRAESTSRMKILKRDCKGLADTISDPETKKAVQRVEDEIRYSDLVSNEQLQDIENELEMAVSRYKDVIRAGNKAAILAKSDEVLALVKNRNKVCKGLK